MDGGSRIRLLIMKRLQSFSPAWFRRHKWASLGLLVIILSLGFWGYETYSRYTDKRSFENARAAIDVLYADIVSEVGPPDNYKHTNDCSRPSGVYEEGPLSCSVGTSFIYGVDSQAEANSLYKKIQGTVARKSELFKPSQPLSAAIEDTLVVNTHYYSALDRYVSNSLPCTIKYIYNTAREIDLEIVNQDYKPFQVSISCSDFAKKEYYPIHR